MEFPRLLLIASLGVTLWAVCGCDGDGTSAPPAPCRHCLASLPAQHDNTIYEDDGPVDLSAGNFAHLFAGWTLEDAGRIPHRSLERRALIQFDVAGILPSGATVDSVVLHLSVTRSHPGALPKWFKLHRVEASWGEGASFPSNEGGGGTPAQEPDATWRHRFYPDSLWTTEGGQFATAASGSSRVGIAGRRFHWRNSWQMTADVQLWLDQPDSNFGWIVLGDRPVDPTVEPTTRRFASREHLDTRVRPLLQVYFTSP